MHNLPVLAKGPSRCTLMVHPADAAKLGLADGDQAKVATRVSSLTTTVAVTDEVMQGVVSLPHGWGHNLAGSQLAVAGLRPGVNANLLTDDADLETLTGTAVLNGVPVTLHRVTIVEL